MPRRLVIAPHFEWLLRHHDGVVTIEQAEAAGHTRRSVWHLVKSRQWQRLLPGVLLTTNQQPSRRQRVIAAVLWAGPDATVDAASACRWHGTPVPNLDEDTVHVVVPYSSGARSRDFVVVRRSDVIVRAPGTGVVRYVDAATAAVVAARSARDERAAVSLLARPLQQALVTPDDLVAAHVHAPPKGAALVTRALEHLLVGVRSAGEVDARRLVESSRVLPHVMWNQWLRLPDGGALVCVDGLIDDAGMVLEVNGRRYHAWALDFEDTEARQLRLVSCGLVVAPLTPHRMRVAGSAALRELERTYVAHRGRGLPPGVEIVPVPGWAAA